MKNIKTRNLIQFILQFVALSLSLVGLFMMGFSKAFRPFDLVKYFTLLSNMVLCLACLVGIPFNIIRLTGNNFKTPRAIYVIKYVACVSIFITFLTVVTYLDPSSQYQLLFSAFVENLFLHYLAPLIYIISFIGFELDSKRRWINILWAPFLPIVYASYCIPLVSNKIWEDPYGFLDFAKFKEQGQWWIGLIVIVAFVVGTFLIGLIVFSLNRLIGNRANKYDLSYQSEIDDHVPVTMLEDENIVEEEVAIEEEPVVLEDEIVIEEKHRKNEINLIKNALKKAKHKNRNSSENNDENKEISYKKTYHIAKRKSDNMWQVKFANGKRALKLFETQADAIEYTKKIIAKNNGAMLIHNSKGKNKGRIKAKK